MQIERTTPTRDMVAETSHAFKHSPAHLPLTLLNIAPPTLHINPTCMHVHESIVKQTSNSGGDFWSGFNAVFDENMTTLRSKRHATLPTFIARECGICCLSFFEDLGYLEGRLCGITCAFHNRLAGVTHGWSRRGVKCVHVLGEAVRRSREVESR